MNYKLIILAAAKAAKVSGALLLAICTQETGLKNSLSPKDGHTSSYGICQVKHETAQFIGFKGTANQLMDPAINAKWAARYLAYQSKRYNNDWCKSTAAYNAGSFLESATFPGLPKNLKYVRKVQGNISDNLKYRLSCTEEIAAQ